MYQSIDIGNSAQIISTIDRYGYRQLPGFPDNKFLSCLDGKVPGVHPKAKVVEGNVCSVDKILAQKNCWL